MENECRKERMRELEGHRMGWGAGSGRLRAARLEGLTTSATGLFVTAVHAVGIRITAPAQGDAMATLALELVHVTAGSAVFLWAWSQQPGQLWQPGPNSPKASCSSHSPHLNHPHSHGPHRTSSAQRCSGHWHRRIHSQSRAGGLGRDRGETGPRRVGTET